MAAKQTVSHLKGFSNLDEVLDKMLELGFFGGYPEWRDQAKAELTDETFDPERSNEFWFSNGVIEVKIFTRLFGAFELCNFRGIKHKNMEAIFAVADRPKVA